MKAMSQNELENVIGTTKVLRDCRLQEVITFGEVIGLAFWTPGQILWLMADLNPQAPIVLPFSEQPLSIANKKSPLQLFLRAHFVGRVLKDIFVQRELGRVVKLVFSDDAKIEIRLFPRGTNIIAAAHSKQISYDVVQPLLPNVEAKGVDTIRDLQQLREQWLSLRQKNAATRLKKDKEPLHRDLVIAKKEKALLKVREEIQAKLELPQRKVADWLKANQSLDVPKDWEPFVDKRRKLAWNIEQCYAQAKETERKLLGTQHRAQKLEDEIESLKQQTQVPGSGVVAAAVEPIHPLKLANAEGRSLKLSSGIYVVAGKSGADNLKLLRKARSWDYWIHVKDHPSSHAIVFRNKNGQVSNEEWQQMAQWFLKMSLGKKADKHVGERFDLLIAECRFVTPVKGDRLGRVTYRQERVLPIRFQTT